LFVYLPLN
jgi:hypothetical protein